MSVLAKRGGRLSPSIEDFVQRRLAIVGKLRQHAIDKGEAGKRPTGDRLIDRIVGRVPLERIVHMQLGCAVEGLDVVLTRSKPDLAVALCPAIVACINSFFLGAGGCWQWQGENVAWDVASNLFPHGPSIDEEDASVRSCGSLEDHLLEHHAILLVRQVLSRRPNQLQDNGTIQSKEYRPDECGQARLIESRNV